MKRNIKGFTLIELLSTVIILGIIATIAIQTYSLLILKNDDSKYNYYWDFIEKGADLYFDAKKVNMISGECLSVNYQTLVDKDYIKEEGVTCTGNIILKKENKKYVYDDANLECKSNDKIVKEKGDVETTCSATQSFTFDENYERENNIATNMTASIDKWKNVSTVHTVKESYDLASAKKIAFTECSGECGIYQNLTKSLMADKTYSWSILLKANSGKNLKVGVGTTGIKTVTTTGNWQRVSGEFVATSSDSSIFSILSTVGFQASGDDLYINSVIVYERSQSLKNKLSFEIDLPFGEGLPIPVREGWNFIGWFTEPIGGTEITKDTVVSNGKNITYYAHWTKKDAKVNYLANGGNGTMSTDTITYGNDYTIKNNTFTRTGYVFDYWKDIDNNQNFKIWPSTPITWDYSKDINLSAIWKANTYTVAYDGNGATSGSTTSSTHTYGTAKELTANGFSKTGYTFDGWNTKANGTGTTYTDKQSVKNLTTTNGETVTLYAIWKANTYTVTFNANGGSVSTTSTTVSYDSTYGSLPTPTRELYEFNGWYTQSSGGTKITDSTTVAITADQTLYAHWKILGICLADTEIGTCIMNAKTKGFNSNSEGSLYRYQGTEVDNYICFGTSDKSTCLGNTDRYMYRIIGVNSSEQVKLIKMTSIGEMQWYSNNASNITWSNTPIRTNINGSSYLTNTTYLPSGWNSKILSTTWKYGSNKTYNTSASNLYNIENSFSTTVNQKIALLYLHDYYYSYQSGGLNCSIDSSYATCKKSWLHLSNNDKNLPADNDSNKYFPSGEWIINRYGTYSSSTAPYRATSIEGGGYPSMFKNYRYYSIRPVFYLTKTVKYKSGFGTITDPIIVS